MRQPVLWWHRQYWRNVLEDFVFEDLCSYPLAFYLIRHEPRTGGGKVGREERRDGRELFAICGRCCASFLFTKPAMDARRVKSGPGGVDPIYSPPGDMPLVSQNMFHGMFSLFVCCVWRSGVLESAEG